VLVKHNLSRIHITTTTTKM